MAVIREQLVSKSDDFLVAVEFQGMSWDEAREMQESRLIEFGAHTVSHQILS